MARNALAAGLTVWAGNAPALAAGFAATLAVAAAGYAVIIVVSPAGAVTLVAFAMVAGLALAGWWRFCARVAGGGGARWRDLTAGFADPLLGLAAGLGPAVVVAAPAWLAYRVAAAGLAPGASAWAAVAAAWAAAPAALTLPFTAMAQLQARPPGWRRGLIVAPVVVAIAVPGPALWLFLETRAHAGFAAVLPDVVAPYGPGVLRLVGIAGVLLSLSAASCVWAAACVAPGDGEAET